MVHSAISIRVFQNHVCVIRVSTSCLHLLIGGYTIKITFGCLKCSVRYDNKNKVFIASCYVVRVTDFRYWVQGVIPERCFGFDMDSSA